MFEKLLRTLEEIGQTKKISIPIEADPKGYIDKQCPNSECEFLFKVHEQDWSDAGRGDSMWCPMCGLTSPTDQWFTKEQVEHARAEAVSMLQGKINDAMREDANAFNARQRRDGFIRMSMAVTGGRNRTFVIPAAAREEMQLEIRCERCTCRFSVIGAAYFCSSCGHSSADRVFEDSLRKIRAKTDNVEVVRSAIASRGQKDDAELTCRSLVESSLADGVTAFQRFCESIYPGSEAVPKSAFQRINQGSRLWRIAIGAGYEEVLDGEELHSLKVLFQRRHLLAHQEGIVDEDYLKKSGDTSYKAGQRVVVTAKDVDALVVILDKLAKSLRVAIGRQDKGS
ncbi:MAG TPA: hypothetical protein VN782_15860 [Usitatibacter sp.]|nr:hypothetical protein [Usitatibacter sp.]